MLHLYRAAAVGIAALSVVAHAAPITTSLTVDGAVGAPSTYTLAGLRALTPTTQTDTFSAGGTQNTDTYTGVTLWNLLNASGGIVTNPAIKNDLLNKVVLVTGSDGYRVVYAAGEINPAFGNRPYLAAYSDTAGTLGNGGSAGFVRTTAPGDVAGGRYVSNVANVTVLSDPSKQKGIGGGTSTSFTVSGGVTAPKTFDLAALQAMAPTTQTDTYTSAGKPVTDTYTGVNLWTLLTSVGIVTDSTIKNDILDTFVIATGSDGYQVAISLGEIDPAFGNQQDLIAFSDTGGQFPGSGFARLTVPGDTAGGRYISNLVSLEIFSALAVPEPDTLPLISLGAVAVMALRRRRSSRGALAG